MLYIDIPHAFLNIFLFLLAGILSEAGETRFLLWWSHIVVGAVCTVVHCRIDGDAGVIATVATVVAVFAVTAVAAINAKW